MDLASSWTGIHVKIATQGFFKICVLGFHQKILILLAYEEQGEVKGSLKELPSDLDVQF